MSENLPTARADPLGVNRDDDQLAAEFLCRGLDEAAIPHRGGVDRDLVGAGEEEVADVLDRPHAAADGQRHEASLGGATHDIEQNAAILMARGDVEETELV